MAAQIGSLTLSKAGRLRLAFLGLALVLVGGTSGMMVIEDMRFLDALYMVVITLSTVGYGEVQPLHDAGRIFVMVVITFGVATVTLFATVVGEVIFEGQFTELVARRKMESSIAKLENHSIIAGFGRVGRQVALEFSRRNVPFVVLERRAESHELLTELGYLYYEGDATNEEVLHHVGISRAKTLISTLPEEAQNVYLTLTARYMNPQLTIIARADYEEGEKKLTIAGANHVVVPHILGGTRMAMASLQPNVLDFMRMTVGGSTEGLVVEELLVPEGSWLANRTLANSEIKQKYGANIVGIKKQNREMLVNPDPATELRGGDVLVVIGEGSRLERLSRELKG
ncbi:MAG: potassium channel protein [bacterium]|nr:potassium channel protein [bacterium]